MSKIDRILTDLTIQKSAELAKVLGPVIDDVVAAAKPGPRTTIIPVTEMRIGMIIAEGKGVRINTLDPCTQRDKVHVNGGMCYDYCGDVVVISSSIR
jgi:hypothetical protein